MILKPETYEGKIVLLNNVKEGTILEFEGVARGCVREIWSKMTYGQTHNVCEARLWVMHDDGGESYHTYRHDGRSQHDSDFDIKLVINKEQ